MGVLGGEYSYRFLRRVFPRGSAAMQAEHAYESQSKLGVLLGNEVWSRIAGMDVIDFGAGEGRQAIELAQRGARSVVGVELRESLRTEAAQRAHQAGVSDRVQFLPTPNTPVDVVISLDSFEHFSDPPAILAVMHGMLRPGGVVLVSFGPTWYHPYGGHLFSVFPWAHLVFTERALIRWRSDFKDDGATRFAEVEGGLNQMTVARFERMVKASPFELLKLETVPIRRLRPVHTSLTREFTTSIVRATLRRPAE